ncbi:hypothetical protein BH23CHL2_BH23CHL2_14310 [soil metagenome]
MRLIPLIGFLVIAVFLAACGNSNAGDVARSPTAALGPLPTTAPPLPFADNPDPEACGIPREWGRDEPGYVTGHYEGELVQPVVYLYDSHLRREVVGQIPDGGRVEILLSQSNPVLDYYLVRSLDLDEPQEGWIPAPFLDLG